MEQEMCFCEICEKEYECRNSTAAARFDFCSKECEDNFYQKK